MRGLARLAHAHCGYLYTDIIQAAGAFPLTGRHGNGFCGLLRLQVAYGRSRTGIPVRAREVGGSRAAAHAIPRPAVPRFRRPIFPHDSPGAERITWQYARPCAGTYYEVGNISNVAAAAQSASLPYILRLGVENILAHSLRLTDRLQREMPTLGFPCITPEGNQSPTVAFVVPDSQSTRAKLARARVSLKVEWHQMRVSPAVYNNDADIDRLLNALG